MTHCKTYACIKPDGDGCDGKHCNDSIEQLHTELAQVKAERDELHAKLDKAVEALKKYLHYIPMYKVITPGSADYEKEYGVGRTAREALAKIGGIQDEKK